MRKGPALGAGSLQCPRPRCSAPLPRPPSSALSSASPAPRPCASRLQLLLSFSSLTPPRTGVDTRCRPRPRHPRRPGQAAAQATSARPGVLAERDRGLRPKPTQVRAARRRRGCRLLFYVSGGGGGGRREGPGPFSWKGGSGRFFIKEAQWLLLQREGWRAGQMEKRDPFLGYFSPTRKD